MNSERKAVILSLIKQEGEVRLNKLRELFPEVSEMTLRRDLDNLERENLVQRTHGGARLLQSQNSIRDFSTPCSLSLENNNILSILKNAAGFLEEERSIYIDSGAIMLSFAESLPDMRLYTITNAPDVGLAVMKKVNPEVILLGGALNKSAVSLTGPFALDIVDRLNIDIAYISAAGLSLESGFTTPYFGECELKQKVISTAKKVIVLIDHSRINRTLPFTFASFKDVDVVVTDRQLPQDICEAASAQNAEIIF